VSHTTLEAMERMYRRSNLYQLMRVKAIPPLAYSDETIAMAWAQKAALRYERDTKIWVSEVDGKFIGVLDCKSWETQFSGPRTDTPAQAIIEVILRHFP